MSGLTFGEETVFLDAKRSPWSLAGLIGLLLVGGLILAGVGLRDLLQLHPPVIFTPAAQSSASAVPKLPSAPVDGVLTLAIPPGAAADQRAGGRGYEMPTVISLRVGDTIVLRNDDDAPHMILYAFLLPGESHQLTFTEPGSEVYSSGCGVHGASILNFTTIFVSA